MAFLGGDVALTSTADKVIKVEAFSVFIKFYRRAIMTLQDSRRCTPVN